MVTGTGAPPAGYCSYNASCYVYTYKPILQYKSIARLKTKGIAVSFNIKIGISSSQLIPVAYNKYYNKHINAVI